MARVHARRRCQLYSVDTHPPTERHPAAAHVRRSSPARAHRAADGQPRCIWALARGFERSDRGTFGGGGGREPRFAARTLACRRGCGTADRGDRAALGRSGGARMDLVAGRMRPQELEMARGVRLWVAITILTCGVIAAANLPLRGTRTGTQGRFVFSRLPQPTPARQRAQRLADEWRAAQT